MHMQEKMSSKRNQQQNEAGARKGNKKTRTVGKKTGPAVNRWHHQLARACLCSHLGMRASSCSHEKNNCVPRDGAGESTWSETRASVTQKQSWLSSTRSQLPANTVINELQWNEMKANESFNAVTCRPCIKTLSVVLLEIIFHKVRRYLKYHRRWSVSLKIDYLGLLVSFKDQMERPRLRLQKCRRGRGSGQCCITAAAVLC